MVNKKKSLTAIRRRKGNFIYFDNENFINNNTAGGSKRGSENRWKKNVTNSGNYQKRKDALVSEICMKGEHQ